MVNKNRGPFYLALESSSGRDHIAKCQHYCQCASNYPSSTSSGALHSHLPGEVTESGRMCLPAKEVWVYAHRGFKSHPLRKPKPAQPQW